jgi:hypothetical protein
MFRVCWFSQGLRRWCMWSTAMSLEGARMDAKELRDRSFPTVSTRIIYPKEGQ